MPQDKFAFLYQEYTALWEAYGVEPLPFGDPANARKRMPRGEKSSGPRTFESLEKVREWLGDCKRCGLCETRKKIVFGTGNENAKLLFVGEGPGADEDEQGIPFVGRAGQLLTKIIEAMGYARSEVYIANVVKCRPPNNRTPLPEEVAQCFPFLKAQIAQLSPRWIVALGSSAASSLMGTQESISRLRGRFHKLPWDPNILVMPTYHPAYLLRNPAAKKMVWEDMKLVKNQMETPS